MTKDLDFEYNGYVGFERVLSGKCNKWGRLSTVRAMLRKTYNKQE